MNFLPLLSLRKIVFLWTCLAAIVCLPSLAVAGSVTLLHTPQSGLQPQAVVDAQGTLHLIYFQGDPARGNVFYVHKTLGADAPFSPPIRVNRRLGSATAIGTIRGAQLAVGRNGRVYVAWNGSDQAPKGPGGAPMLFTRLDSAKAAFEPERNLISLTGGIDGGGSLAADTKGNVYVTWHASKPDQDEASGGVYLTKSTDDGATFTSERRINVLPTGQCGCCSMRAFVDHADDLYILYRAAGDNYNRDTTLLVSRDKGMTFQSGVLSKWKLGACPMSSFSLAESGMGVVCAWETAGQVFYMSLAADASQRPAPVSAPGVGSRKYPVVIPNSSGEMLFAWVEGSGWERGGRLPGSVTAGTAVLKARLDVRTVCRYGVLSLP